MTQFNTILYGVDERVATITLNRPEKRNALTLEMRAELVRALKTAERDDAVSVVLIAGAGPMFCSGYDMAAASTPDGGYVSESLFDTWTDQFARHAIDDWLVIWDLLKPVVCKVHGACLAGATELMSLCDITFAADDARFAYPPMRAQSTPDTVFFPWKLPMAQAKYLQLTGNAVSGRQAFEMGWITKSFPPGQLDEQTWREVRAIASIPPDLLAANKLALNQVYEMMGFRTALKAGVAWHTLSGKYRPSAGEFRRIAEARGLKDAIRWRDGAFTELGG